MLEELQRGRDAYRRQAWSEAYAHLSAADVRNPLDPEDLERLATAAYLSGKNAESNEIWVRAHHVLLGGGDVPRAVRCAFWLAFQLFNSGETARGGGWVSRGRRLIEDSRLDCVETGYLLFPVALRSVLEGDNETGHSTFAAAAEIGERFEDPDLIALARQGQGRALIRMGEIDAGVALLDEAMADVESGAVSPIAAGDIYCSLIEACHEIFDVHRAQEWTEALNQWCEAQTDLHAYRGQCLVRRSEIMQVRGDWANAMEEAQRAAAWLLRPPPQGAAGAAYYQQAELHRLRGEFAEAEDAYRLASQWGRRPQPGLALLRLAEGELDAAEAAIRTALDGADTRPARARLLPSYVEILCATGDSNAARAGARELAEIADSLNAPMLRAMAAYADGSVFLGEGDPRPALARLRQAWLGWTELGAPYYAGRTSLLIGLACQQLGDYDTANMEIESARRIFQTLGARPDLARTNELSRNPEPASASMLTRRQMEVLRLLAAGKTNRAIAEELCISEKTVARHVSNIFLKLEISSRAAAIAYAYEHRLL